MKSNKVRAADASVRPQVLGTGLMAHPAFDVPAGPARGLALNVAVILTPPL